MGQTTLNFIGLGVFVCLIYYMATRERPSFMHSDVKKPGEEWSPQQYEPEKFETVQVGEIGDPPDGLADRLVQITDTPAKS